MCKVTLEERWGFVSFSEEEETLEGSDVKLT